MPAGRFEIRLANARDFSALPRPGFRIVESAVVTRHVELEARERERGLRTDLGVTMAFGIAAG